MKKTVYAIVNSCTGDSECSPASVYRTGFVSKEKAFDYMKKEAEGFCKDEDLDVEDLEYEGDAVHIDYCGVDHRWEINELTVNMEA